MVHCKQCGVEIFPDDHFCHACGAKVDLPSPSLDIVKTSVDQLESRIKKRTGAIIFFVAIPSFIGLFLFILKFTLGLSVFGLFDSISFSPDEEEVNLSEVQDENILVEQNGNSLSVGPTLTAFALENQALLAENNIEETAVPVVEVNENEPVVIFEEDFEGNSTSAIPLLSSEYLTFSTISGEGFLSSGYDPGVLPIVFPDIVVADFIAEFDCMAPEAYEDTNFGFIFRADETIEDGLDSFYALYIFPQQNAYQMGLWIDGDWYKTDKVEFENPINTGYAMNHFQLLVEGTEMDLYANGEFVSGFSEDSNLNAGLMGFFISPSASLPEDKIDLVILDNFIVYQP